MSPAREDYPPKGMDEIERAYRAANFDDEPPSHVDDVILEAARQSRKRNLNTYLPPLAMAATVLLALGLVLRLTVPSRETLAPAGPEPAAILPAAEPTADTVQRLRMQERATPAEESAAPLADFVTPVPATAPAAAVAADDAAREDAARSVAGGLAAPAPAAAPCTANERSDPGAWLACIEVQLGAGALEAARAELAVFLTTYPDYSVPANITEALYP